MKNVTCRKLVIDRSKAPDKLGTLKDISLYGSFEFPSSGGLVARSLAGVGKELRKSQQQLQSLSGRTHPIAGATGAATTDDIPFSSDNTFHQNQNQENYSVNFIQHATVHQQPPDTNGFRSVNAEIKESLPKSGFALKTGGGKRTVFTLEQKETMIKFYNRQANYGIRADPVECMSAMRDRGLAVLKESQIKSWWSSYHQKRKREMERMAADIQQAHAGIATATSASSNRTSTASVPVTSAANNHQPTASVPVTSAATNRQPTASVPVTSAATNHPPTASVPVTSAATNRPPTASVPVTSAATNCQPTASVPVTSAATNRQPTASVPVTSAATNCQPTASVPVTSATASCVSTTTFPTVTTAASSLPNLPPAANLIVTDAGYGITEWYFPVNVSQSTLDGRNGSNACVFIALSFGSIY